MPEWVTIFHPILTRTDGFTFQFGFLLFIIGCGMIATLAFCALGLFCVNASNISDDERCKNSKNALYCLVAMILCVPLGNYAAILLLIIYVGAAGFMFLKGIVRSISSCRHTTR